MNTVSEFLATLRRSAADYKFEEFLEQALRDRLVCGVKSESLRRRLLLEKELILAKATEIAVAMEAANKDSKAIEAKLNETVKVLHIRNKEANEKTTKPITVACYRCGRQGHLPQNCRFKEALCHCCGKMGHIAMACRNKLRQQNPRLTHKQVQLDSEEEEEEEELSQLNGIEERNIQLLNAKPLMEVYINRQRVWMEIDTGAAVSVISQKILQIPVKQSSKQLRSATGQILELAGEAKVKVQVKGKRKVVKYTLQRGSALHYLAEIGSIPFLVKIGYKG